jgi:hypothetical protein
MFSYRTKTFITKKILVAKNILTIFYEAYKTFNLTFYCTKKNRISDILKISWPLSPNAALIRVNQKLNKFLFILYVLKPYIFTCVEAGPYPTGTATLACAICSIFQLEH